MKKARVIYEHVDVTIDGDCFCSNCLEIFKRIRYIQLERASSLILQGGVDFVDIQSRRDYVVSMLESSGNNLLSKTGSALQ